MPSNVSFIQLEGNYVISFRDTSECLPAFTAVRLDRRRNSAASLVPEEDDSDLTPRRRRRRSASMRYKLVITGIPAHVPTHTIKARLDDCFPGIVRVYRDPDMAGEMAVPPVFVETLMSIARDTFMLHSDSWLPAVQRLIKETARADGPVDEVTTSVRFNVQAEDPDDKDRPKDKFKEKAERRKSLVALSVSCPHGRYLGDDTCPMCKHKNRRSSFVVDDVIAHSPIEEQPAPVFVVPTPLADLEVPKDSEEPPPDKPSSSWCPCVGWLRRLICPTKPPPSPPTSPAPRLTLRVAADAPEVVVTGPPVDAPRVPVPELLNPHLLASLKSQRRYSAYDVPVTKSSPAKD